MWLRTSSWLHGTGGLNLAVGVAQFRDYTARAVGRCRESVRIKDGLDVDARVLRMRYAEHPGVSAPSTRCIPHKIIRTC